MNDLRVCIVPAVTYFDSMKEGQGECETINGTPY